MILEKEDFMEEKSDTSANSNHARLLRGHVALITGASRGIGAATARLFAQHGAAVGVNYHTSAARAQEVVKTIRAFGGRAIAIEASVDSAEEVEAMVQRVEQELGPIDTLVMNAIADSKSNASLDKHVAAVRSIFTPFLESDWEHYQNSVIRQLSGVYVPARIMAPLMVERKRGNLIAVSSTVARMSYLGTSALASGKASVEALMRVLVSELGPHGIRVNAVSPGPTRAATSR